MHTKKMYVYRNLGFGAYAIQGVSVWNFELVFGINGFMGRLSFGIGAYLTP